MHSEGICLLIKIRKGGGEKRFMAAGNKGKYMINKFRMEVKQ